MTEPFARVSQAGLVEKVQALNDKMSKKSTSEASTKRVGKRGRRPSKVDVKVKLERSRQSARECRARKKLRYQYLEELVNSREKAVYALRDELEQFRQVCESIDNGHIPDGLESLLAPTPSNPKRKSQKAVVKVESDSEETPYDILMDVLGNPGTSQQSGESSKNSPVGSDAPSSYTDDSKQLLSQSSSSSDSTQSSSRSPITPTQEDPTTTSFSNIQFDLADILGVPSTLQSAISRAGDAANGVDVPVCSLYESAATIAPSVFFQTNSSSSVNHFTQEDSQTSNPVATNGTPSYNTAMSLDVDQNFQNVFNAVTFGDQTVSRNIEQFPVYPDASTISTTASCDTNSMFYNTSSMSTSALPPVSYQLNVSAVGQVTGDAQHDGALLNSLRTASSLWYPSNAHDQNTRSGEDIQEILSSTP